VIRPGAVDQLRNPGMHVMHIIIGLDPGGAELMLKRLIEADRANPEYHHSVVSLTTRGVIGDQLLELGVEVRCLQLRSMLGAPRAFWKLVQLLRSSRPAIVQTWMYHADIMGGVAARVAGITNIVWGIRSSTPLRRFSISFVLARACALVSSIVPAVISCNSETGRDAHVAIGYDRRKITVVPNGCDVSRFTNSPALREASRTALGFARDDVVVGTIGRFDPHKDLKTFVRAAGDVARADRRVRILMVGKGLEHRNEQLHAMVHGTGEPGRFVLAGRRGDPVACFAALDVFCLSSIREGFPNAVVEAMAMEVPCVVTTAGDAPQIVAETGEVVAAQDPAALAEALLLMVNMKADDRAVRGRMARARVEAYFSMPIASARFHALYRQLTARSTVQADAPPLA